MKKQALLLILSLTLIIGSAFSRGTKQEVPSPVLSAFNADYENATQVSWEEGMNWYKASFRMHDVYLTAYYNAAGETIGVSRNIATTQLPLVLLKDLKENYSSYWVTDLFELANYDQTSYYMTLENADEILVLEGHDGYWSIYKKTKKG